MGDAFQKVQPGHPLQIPAAAWNAFIDTAIAHREGDRTSEHPPLEDASQGAIILVRNDSGYDLDQFGILGLTSPLIHPTDSEQNFVSRIAMAGVTPTRQSHAGMFVIAQEPIASGKIGRAALAGLSIVRLSVGASPVVEPRFADVADSQRGYLEAVQVGSASILWRQGGTGEQWALVRLGQRNAHAAFPVTLTQLAGAQGDEASPATWTYIVQDAISGQLLAIDVNPVQAPHQWRRPGAGAMTPATFGYAHFDNDDALVVGWINEVVQQEACS